MTSEEKAKILDRLGVLRGAVLCKFGRLGATGNLCFRAPDGKEWWLRIQTAFRMRDPRQKEWMGNLDMFEPTQSVMESPAFAWESFNWDVQGANRYDAWVTAWKTREEDPVESFAVSDLGDLTIRFSAGTILEIFLNSFQGECWRFFEADSDSDHLVVTGQGIEA